MPTLESKQEKQGKNSGGAKSQTDIKKNISLLKSLAKEKIKNRIVLATTKNLYSIARTVFVLWMHAQRNIKKGILFLRHNACKNSIFIFKEELGMCELFPKKIIDKTIEIMNPKSVLDLGCGAGKSLGYFLSRGINAFGVEGSALAISKANNQSRIAQFNLNKELNLGRKFDLIWSFEFIEHIHPKYKNNLMKTFSNHSDKIVMSAAQPNQGGDGHFNEQPQAYWVKEFEMCGYKFNSQKTSELRMIDEQFSKNMYVFER